MCNRQNTAPDKEIEVKQKSETRPPSFLVVKCIWSSETWGKKYMFCRVLDYMDITVVKRPLKSSTYLNKLILFLLMKDKFWLPDVTKPFIDIINSSHKAKGSSI